MVGENPMTSPRPTTDTTPAITAPMIDQIEGGAASVVVRSGDRVGVLTRLDYQPHTYLYSARVFDPQLANQLNRGAAVLNDYRQLIARARSLQLQFNAALLILALASVWIVTQP